MLRMMSWLHFSTTASNFAGPFLVAWPEFFYMRHISRPTNQCNDEADLIFWDSIAGIF
jgi:hypothetical protein